MQETITLELKKFHKTFSIFHVILYFLIKLYYFVFLNNMSYSSSIKSHHHWIHFPAPSAQVSAKVNVVSSSGVLVNGSSPTPLGRFFKCKSQFMNHTR